MLSSVEASYVLAVEVGCVQFWKVADRRGSFGNARRDQVRSGRSRLGSQGELRHGKTRIGTAGSKPITQRR